MSLIGYATLTRPWILGTVAGILACDPIAEREAAWWDARRTDQLGINLIPIEAGEPLAYTPRVVVTRAHTLVDNRAWYLSLPESQRTPERLVERDLPSALDAAQQRGMLITPLYDALLDLVDIEQALGERDGSIALVFEPDIPAETVRAVVYTASQATFSTYALAGVVDGRLRAAGAMDASQHGCPIEAVAHLRAADSHASLPATPPLRGASCTAPLADSLRALAERCQPHWAQAACIRVHLSAEDRLPAEAMLRFLARTHAHHPQLRQGYLMGGPGEPVSCEDAVSIASLTEAQLAHVCTAGDVLAARPRWDRDEVYAWDADARAAFPVYSDRVLRQRAQRRGIPLAQLIAEIDAPPTAEEAPGW